MVDTRFVSLERVLLGVVLVLSLALRLTALDGFSTVDEGLWHDRATAFDKALASQQWERTYQAGHPGVVTMWLGAIANRLQWLQQPSVLDSNAVYALMQSPAPPPGTGVAPLTLGARRLVALVTWLGIVALYALLRKLFGRDVALLATALVGLDPFFLAHSRLHHLDGLLTTFVALSAISLLVYQWRGQRMRYLLASVATAGLAIASKSPGVILLPWAGLALVLPALWKTRSLRHRDVWRAVGVFALWLLGAALVVVAIWPAMWVHPLTVLQNVFGVAKAYAETPHENSNYFWFAVRPDPGPGFYPVVWAFRTTPWVLLGLVWLVAAWREKAWRSAGVAMFGWALLFTVAMTIGEKKGDRYLLPIFPVLDVLAAVGWMNLARRWLHGRVWRQWVPAGLAGVLALGQLLVLWPSRPYYLAYYNLAVGGSKTAPQVMQIGWGEGLDRAAAYLNAKPDAGEIVVSGSYTSDFGEFFVGETLGEWTPGTLSQSDYFILYRNVAQRAPALVPEELRQLMAEEAPEHIISVNGIEYAAIYRNTLYRQAEEEIVARIASEGDGREHVILVAGNAPLARGYDGSVRLVEFAMPDRDDATQMALQEASAGRKHIWHLEYPGGCQGGCIALAGQLVQHSAVGEELEVGGLRVVRYDLPDGPAFVRPPTVALGAHFGSEITLEGYDSGETLVPGQPFRIRLRWRADAPVGTSYTVFVHLLGPDGKIVVQADGLPQGGRQPTTAWPLSRTVLDDRELAVPADAPVGTYSIVIGLYNLDTMQRLDALDATGQSLPDDALVIGSVQIRAK